MSAPWPTGVPVLLFVLAAPAAALVPLSGSAQGAGSGAPGQTRASADTLRLSVTQAVARGLEESEEVELAREQITLAESQIRQARSGLFPQVTANLNYDRVLRSVFDIQPAEPEEPDNGEEPGFDLADLFGDLPFGQPNTWNASLQINQSIYTGGRLGAGMDIAERARSASRLTLSEAESEMIRDVRQAYFQAVHAASRVEIAEEAHALAQAQLEQVESFREQGTASDFEVLQARVERDNLEPAIVEARNARNLAELNLRRLVNVPRDQPLELTSPLDADLVEVDLEALIEAALQRPSVRTAGEQVRIQEELVRVTRADRLPTLSAFANFSFQAFPERIVPSSFPGTSQWRDDWSVGLRASMSVFDGFRTSAAMQEARSNVRTAALQRDQLQEAVILEVESAFAEYQGARAQIEARRATVQEAERALELAELRYENGLARLIELSNARLLLQQARSNEANGLLNYVSALAALEHAAGGHVQLLDP